MNTQTISIILLAILVLTIFCVIKLCSISTRVDKLYDLYNFNVPSDSRLKHNISHIDTQNGIKMYSFQYLWGPETYKGVMAQDLLNTKHKDAVSIDSTGYYRVNYKKLGLEMTKIE